MAGHVNQKSESRTDADDADFSRLNRGFARITRNDADFGVPRGSAFLVGVGLVPTLCAYGTKRGDVGNHHVPESVLSAHRCC